MHYISYYQSPIGKILLAADTESLTGLWFDGEKYFAHCLEKQHEEAETPILHKTKPAAGGILCTGGHRRFQKRENIDTEKRYRKDYTELLGENLC